MRSKSVGMLLYATGCLLWLGGLSLVGFGTAGMYSFGAGQPSGEHFVVLAGFQTAVFLVASIPAYWGAQRQSDSTLHVLSGLMVVLYTALFPVWLIQLWIATESLGPALLVLLLWFTNLTLGSWFLRKGWKAR